jgi:hypothetical protein
MSEPLKERYDYGTHLNHLGFQMNALEEKINALEDSYTNFHNLYCDALLPWTETVEELLKQEINRLTDQWLTLYAEQETKKMLWDNHIALQNLQKRK